MRRAFTYRVCMTVHLFDMATGQEIGGLTDAQFRFLQAHLEREDADDDDYYLNRATLDAFVEEGADPTLVGMLRAAMGTRDEMDIRWQWDEVEPSAEDEERT